MAVFAELQVIIAQLMEVPEEKVTMDSIKSDFEKWDSLNQLNLVMEVEYQFNISLSIDEITEIHSIQDIVNLVNKHLQ
jgi:acyl carrier protein